MEEIKLKWCVDLEDILQCPICFERPEQPIYQCKDGHHICMGCRLQLKVCPLCEGAYEGSRSFMGESLATKLDEIKSSLISPQEEHKIVSNCTQTVNTEIKSKIIFHPPLAAKGKFPCRIGKCNFDDGYSRMLNHLRYYHKDRLRESTSTINRQLYTHEWEIDNLSNFEYNLAFFIPEMGIFFLQSSIDSSGNFMGNVQMVQVNSVTKEFNYKLEIKGNCRTSSYEGIPRSCRTPIDVAYSNSLQISSQDMRRMSDKRNKVTCIFTIVRKQIKKNSSQKKAE